MRVAILTPAPAQARRGTRVAVCTRALAQARNMFGGCPQHGQHDTPHGTLCEPWGRLHTHALHFPRSNRLPTW